MSDAGGRDSLGEAVEFLPHDGVTFARHRFEPSAVEDVDVAARVANHARPLNLPRRLRPTGAARAENLHDKLVRQIQHPDFDAPAVRKHGDDGGTVPRYTRKITRRRKQKVMQE